MAVTLSTSVLLKDTTEFMGGSVVETSGGTKYALMFDETASPDELVIWKNIDGTPSVASRVSCTTILGVSISNGFVRGAIDSGDDIHVVVQPDNASIVVYRVFDTATDTWLGSGWTTLYTSNQSLNAPYTCDIAIDSNDYPHVVSSHRVKVKGNIWWEIYYTEWNGTSWNSPVLLSPAVTNEDCYYPNIGVDASDDLYVSWWNAADNTIEYIKRTSGSWGSISAFSSTANTDSITACANILVDGSNIYRYWTDASGNIYENDTDTTYNTKTGAVWQHRISAALVGSTRYVFYIDTNSDVAYIYNSGSGWTSGGVLQTGTYITVVAEWAYNNENQSGEINYIFDDDTNVYYDTLSVTTGNRGQVSWAELYISKDAPRRGQMSWAELQTQDAGRRGELSWAELQTQDAGRRGELSWAELETLDSPNRRGLLSWAEFESLDPPRRGQLSWAELRLDDAPRRGQLSWSELQINDAARRGQLSWSELQTQDAGRRGELSWSELQINDAPRRGELSWAELQTQDAGRRGQLSWAEIEALDIQQRGLLSWAELETLDAARRGEVSWTEIELPDVARRGQLSWTELETLDIQQRGLLSWVEIQLPDGPRRGEISWAAFAVPDIEGEQALFSWAEFVTPNAARRGEVSWAEIQINDAPRRGELSWAELQTNNASRRGQASWNELEVPDALRRGETSWAELQVPDAARRGEVSWAEITTPDASRRGEVSWAEIEILDIQQRGEVSWAEIQVPDAPRRGEVSWVELEVTQGNLRKGLLSWLRMEIPGQTAGGRGIFGRWGGFGNFKKLGEKEPPK